MTLRGPSALGPPTHVDKATMSDLQIIETIYGKYHKFEVVKDPGGVFGSIKYYVRKDGKPFKGSYSSLADAVQAATDEG